MPGEAFAGYRRLTGFALTRSSKVLPKIHIHEELSSYADTSAHGEFAQADSESSTKSIQPCDWSKSSGSPDAMNPPTGEFRRTRNA